MTSVSRSAFDTAQDEASLPFQSTPFLTAWAQTRGALSGRVQTVLTVPGADGRSHRIPLEIRRFGPLRIGSFPGETHANAAHPSGHPTGRLDLASAAKRVRLDALDLRRLPDTSWLPEAASVRPALEDRFAITLDGGMEAVLANGNAKRKRKKFRAQQRHFEGLGGYVFRDVPPDARSVVLDTFFALKIARFAELGRPDPFQDPGTEAFLKRLFADADAGARLYIVESGGTVKALMGGLASGRTFWGMFSAFADDEDADASPGELLLWHLVERLSAEGFATLDLGPGEERYKRSWCDLVVPQFDAVMAVTAGGRTYLAASRLRRSIVRRIKEKPKLLAVVQRVRRVLPRR
ncbi:GNAT family N-acetyltransferase [Aureimonas sp. Leaf454]|uniref:GNAT family N-acetyltransferase n=1 Tax=Aureimonas sp. Leaf454 TaxID=1736381 RepID=UPI000A8BABEA|nr:GNAT family N-acetyltransferase [Aureimonas sp. Leaf454]